MKQILIVTWMLTMILAAGANTPPELPRVFLGATPNPAPLQVVPVAAGANLQSAISNATPGDQLQLEAGAYWLTNSGFYFRNMIDSSSWITLTSSRASELPTGRVSPLDAYLMPKIVTTSTSPVFDLYPTYSVLGYTKARMLRFVGLEITATDQAGLIGCLVKIGGSSWQTHESDAPSDIVLDRCYIHGPAASSLLRGVQLNGVRVWVTNCYISEVHAVGADSQAICGWNGAGPFKIANNYLEAAGENFMLGGADPNTAGLVPSDLEFVNNYCFKPLKWFPLEPAFDGSNWSIKNLFELKNVHRAYVAHNVFENNCVRGQDGMSILFTVRNQSGACPQCQVADVTFEFNTITHVPAGVNILGTDNNYPSGVTSRVVVANNRFEDVGAATLGVNGRLFQILGGGPTGAESVTISGNYGQTPRAFLTLDGAPTTNLVLQNNIVEKGTYGIIGSGTGEGNATLSVYAPGAVVTRNVIQGSANPALYPAGNFFMPLP